jgi:polar amino acid transport system substrate-binding protein
MMWLYSFGEIKKGNFMRNDERKKFTKTVWVIFFGSYLLASKVQAAEVDMLFGLSLPPYVIQENNTGYELEIIKAALAVKGHTLKPSYVALAAIPLMLKEKKANSAQRGNVELSESAGFHYAGMPTVIYQDVAITLKKNNLSINGLADLKDKTVLAFQGAVNFLGPEYAVAVKGSANYAETSDDKRKTARLFANSVQIYVGDLNIFNYNKKLMKENVDTNQEVVVHKIFNASGLKTNNAVFLDKNIRDDFEAGLKQIKASGQYQQIIKKYTSE